MPSPVKLYQREMHNNIGVFATWLPGDRIELGDVGVMDGGRFRKLTSLAELKIDWRSTPAGDPRDVEYSAKANTQVAGSAKAGVPEVAKGQIDIEFSEQGAYLFHAKGLRHTSLDDRMKLATRILAEFERKRWQEDWLLVETVYEAEHATIIVSQESTSKLVLEVSVAGPLPISLTNPKLGLTVSSTRGKVISVVAQPGVRPLYDCFRVKDPVIGKPRFVPTRGPAGELLPSLERPSIAELLDR